MTINFVLVGDIITLRNTWVLTRLQNFNCALKINAVCSSETSKSIYQIARCKNINNHRCSNLKITNAGKVYYLISTLKAGTQRRQQNTSILYQKTHT
jgi:hypothetical protein